MQFNEAHSEATELITATFRVQARQSRTASKEDGEKKKTHRAT